MQIQKQIEPEALTEHHIRIGVLAIAALVMLLGCIWTIQDRFHDLNQRLTAVETRLMKLETETK